MTVSRRRFVATGVALTLALTLGACSSNGEGQSPTSTSVEGTVPLTVSKDAAWSASLLEDAPVRVTSLGILTFSAEKSVAGKSYAPVLLSPVDGSPRWIGVAIQSETMPELQWVQQEDDRWAVATATVGNKTSIYSWNGLANHSETALASSSSFEGTKAPPQVSFSGTGVLVAGADKSSPEPMTFWPKDASVTRYKGGPKRDGEAGTPIGAYGPGFLVSFPKGGFSLATATGGWTSTSVSPGDANPQSGTVLAQGDGYIVSEWTRPSDAKKTSTILAVHSALTGQLFAEHEVTKEEAPLLATQKTAGAPLVTEDARWLAWGQIGFDLNKGTGAFYTLSQGVPTAIMDGMLYVRNAYSLIPQPETATASPSTSPSASATPSATVTATPSAGAVDPEAPAGFTGITGIDMVTHQPLSGLPSMYPIGRTSTGQVILRNGSKPAIYSVGIR